MAYYERRDESYGEIILQVRSCLDNKLRNKDV